MKNHGEFFKDRDFHQHVKMLFSGGSEPAGEEEEHNEFFHIPEQVISQSYDDCSVALPCQVTYKDFVSTALKLPSLLTCRGSSAHLLACQGDLTKADDSASSSLQLVIDEEEPPIKA